MENKLTVIARVRDAFPTKFGLPRQSGLVGEIEATIVFEPPFRHPDALRGLEAFSHIWVLWGFEGVERAGWSATVRPPKLGGNARVGVFATRSPFRPNAIALSCVRLTGIEKTEKYGHVLRVSGVDMMDGTAVYDIKPYLPYADCVPDARGGFSDAHRDDRLTVDFPRALLARVPAGLREALVGALARDPRPGYQDDPARVYGFLYGGADVRFRVENGVLTVCDVAPAGEGSETE